MQLSQTAEYALRSMTYLALDGEGPASAQRISEATGIPVAYLSKILRRLVVAGLLHSQKGHGGGFRLAQDSARITFQDVLDAVEPGEEQPHCAFGWESCDPDNPCPLHPAWTELKEDAREWASSRTLAGVARQANRQRRRP